MSTFSQINTNIQSQRAFQNLSDTSEELATRRERLSTGLRINSAEDDAAGFEIANQLEAKTGAQGQALRNIGDAKSTLSTAEGSLSSQLEILQTAKEKATQASNGSLSKSERESIQGELDQLTKEIQDISTNTQFNGQDILKGGSGSQTFSFQTGAGTDNQFDVDIENSKATDLEGTDTDGNTQAVGNNTSDVTDAANLSFNEEGVAGFSLDSTKSGNVQLEDGSGNQLTGASPTNVDGTGELNNLEGGEFKLEISRAQDENGNDEAFRVSVNGSDSGTQLLTAARTGGAGTDLTTISDVPTGEGGKDNTDTSAVVLEKDAGSGEALELNFDGADAQKLDQEIQNADGDTVEATVKVGGDGVEFGVDVADESGEAAEDAIGVIDGAIDQVASELSDIGASQNRLSFKESNLETTRTNLSAAQSRIEDADFAREQTQVAKLQVQQQSGTAQLAQANAAGQSVLSLLQ